MTLFFSTEVAFRQKSKIVNRQWSIEHNDPRRSPESAGGCDPGRSQCQYQIADDFPRVPAVEDHSRAEKYVGTRHLPCPCGNEMIGGVSCNCFGRLRSRVQANSIPNCR